jgi:hypothetical protein
MELTLYNWQIILWDEGQMIRVVSDCTIKGQGDHIIPQKLNSLKYLFVTPNSMIGNRRCEDNIDQRTTFIVEFDELPLDEQMVFVDQIQMPYSTATYSGNKSVHFLIRLTDSISDKREYKRLAKLILLATNNKADPAPLKNSSTFTRVPFAIRKETGRIQKLLKLKKRVSQKELIEWIDSRVLKQKPSLKKRKIIKRGHWGFGEKQKNQEWSIRQLPNWILQKLINNEISEGGRNNSWFSIGCKCCEIGVPYNDSIKILEPYFSEDYYSDDDHSNFLHQDWVNAIENGYRHIETQA